MVIKRKTELADIIGSAHVDGRYNFTDGDHLNEGADALLEMGTRVIKVWVTGEPKVNYPINCDWPKIESLVQLVKLPYFQKLLAKPFTTFIMEAYTPGEDRHYFANGMTPEDIKRERNSMYDFTKYLLTEYKNTGKTFILQNWEGDWILTDPHFTKEPDPVTIQGMIEWLNARQDGVDKAREEVGMEGVTVVHAGEVNLVARAMEGKVTVTNDVVPHTHCDLYSYSSWDTSLGDPAKLKEALDYLATKAPPSKLYGSNNIYMGEFGVPENEFGGPEGQLKIVKAAVEVGLDWGAHYIVYWEVFCNEPAPGFDGKRRPTNSDCRGFWLVRPDGTKSLVWDYFADLIKS